MPTANQPPPSCPLDPQQKYLVPRYLRYLLYAHSLGLPKRYRRFHPSYNRYQGSKASASAPGQVETQLQLFDSELLSLPHLPWNIQVTIHPQLNNHDHNYSHPYHRSDNRRHLIVSHHVVFLHIGAAPHKGPAATMATAMSDLYASMNPAPSGGADQKAEEYKENLNTHLM